MVEYWGRIVDLCYLMDFVGYSLDIVYSFAGYVDYDYQLQSCLKSDWVGL